MERDELLSFYNPPFSNSLFLRGVSEGAEIRIQKKFGSYGLLYKSSRLKSDESVFHIWFYRKSDLFKCYEECHNGFTEQDDVYTITYAKDKKDGIHRLINLNQMYEILNTYIGFEKWNSQIVSVDQETDGEMSINKEGITRYTFQYKVTTAISFVDFLDLTSRGNGRGVYTGKDKALANKLALKLGISCARKNMFRTLGIVFLNTLNGNTVTSKAIPVTINAGKQDDDGIYQIQSCDVDESNPVIMDDDLKDILDTL
ncbi:hypothetical protein EIN_095890 [Entamoeba invadens IP1]|uniref:Uncharacterized protein n=1 Tax=Entamoeba invadens IP1 TaxID=370355 RepID=A0A0A1U0C4_ENTIV|nr:hypothetical protein EIN_095890 [Entamoeba invadens IP1]ELP87332.1 hypothetical protein EIN_095890 [Entamoeba invadens IP1]|eukprot:XP_004254103.1 hypothetical protein EIN_095890 [Entamoeba invadens IP1]